MQINIIPKDHITCINPCTQVFKNKVPKPAIHQKSCKFLPLQLQHCSVLSVTCPRHGTDGDNGEDRLWVRKPETGEWFITFNNLNIGYQSGDKWTVVSQCEVMSLWTGGRWAVASTAHSLPQSSLSEVRRHISRCDTR